MKNRTSVIIPLYNKEYEIKRALDSVLSQTFQDFEVIVVDDCSSDGGPEIVKNVSDPRITLIEQEHHGVAYTRNHGVKLATGDFLAFLDADDEWMPRHLESIMRLIEKYPEAGLFSTAYKIQNNNGKTEWADLKNIPNPPWEGLVPDYFKSVAFGHHLVNASTAVIPKKIFHEMGGFIEGYWWGEDMDLFGKIAIKYPVAFSWELGAIYHWDASNRAGNKNIPLDYVEPFVKTARDALRDDTVPQDIIESLNEYIWKKEYTRAILYEKAGHSDIALKILKQCSSRWNLFENIKWLIWTKLRKSPIEFLRILPKI